MCSGPLPRHSCLVTCACGFPFVIVLIVVCVCNSWDPLGQCCVAVCMLSIFFCVMATNQVECIWASGALGPTVVVCEARLIFFVAPGANYTF